MVKAYDRLVDRYGHEHARLKFAFSQHQRNEILSSIHQKIQTLERILETSDQVASFEQSVIKAVSPRTVNDLVGYWRHADRIYALISSSWVCGCKQSHCAHLWLQHRTKAGFEFRMLVLFEASNCRTSTTPPWQQHGIQIVLKSPDGQLPNQVCASTLLPPPQKSFQSSGAAPHLSKANAPSKRARYGKSITNSSRSEQFSRCQWAISLPNAAAAHLPKHWT
jgi:hypothetical protein